ncbi:MAG: hypothetical protein UHY68_02655 [Acutalibacteraceae bacterium]|nr:hypothetical protein [Acutalibacteraceae bacterium]
MNVTFFGHRKTSKEVKIILRKKLINLIEFYNADTFYVGNQGDFDFMVRQVLKELKEVYPHIAYTVVLAYIPNVGYRYEDIDYFDTIYPEELENTPKKFAISKRNFWLIEHSDIVVTCVHNSVGGAAKFKEIAEKKGKWVINIDDN